MKEDKQVDLMAMLEGVLHGWVEGRLDERDVHGVAEELLASEWQQFESHDPRAAVIEVLVQLDILNQQLITAKDATAMMDFMRKARTDPEEAWQDWNNYWGALDLDARRQELQENPYYST